MSNFSGILFFMKSKLSSLDWIKFHLLLLETDLRLREGDYLIIEDSEGKQSEIVDFISDAKNTYKVDNFYLDFFGRNTTCCVDSIFKVF